MTHIVLAGCLAVFVVQGATAYQVCSEDAVKPLWMECDNTHFVSGVTDEASMKKMCNNVECLIQCKKDAVGDCANREEFRQHLFLYDPEKTKVFFRYSCSNMEVSLQQLNGGCVANQICNPDTEFSLNTTGKNKQAICSMFKNIRQCVSMSPGGECTAAGAMFQEVVRKLGYSLSICDNTDIKDMYTKYGGPIQCGTSGTARIILSLQAIAFAFLIHQF